MKKLPFILFAALLAGCGQKPQNTEYNPVINVHAIMMGANDDNQNRTYIGHIESETEINLSFPLGGKLTQLNVKNGQRVKKGDLIARVDDTSAKSLHDAAKATLRQAKDGYARMAEVHKAGGVSEVRWIQMETDLEKAKQAEISARKHVEDCSIYAPQDGVICMEDHVLGESFGPFAPLCKLLDLSKMQVVFSIPEQEISLIQEGEKATATMPSFPDHTLRIEVCDKGMIANPMGHTYQVKARIEDADGIDLLSGQVAKAHLTSTAPEGLIVPSWCVQTMANGLVVWTIRDGKSYRTPITVKSYVKNGILVASGLEKGDWVITDGYQKLYNGAQVNILEE